MAPAAALVFVVLTAAAVAGFTITRNVARHHERGLLRERAGEASAFLQNSVNTSLSNLAILAVLAASPDRSGFEQAARALARGPASTVSAVVEDPGGLTATSSVGAVPGSGQVLRGDREAVVGRALAQRQPAVDLVRDGGRTAILFAVAAPEPARVVAVLETAIDPTRPLASSPGSPFSEMRGTLYAAPEPDASRIVLTTEREQPIKGRHVQVPFNFANERWTLVAGTRTSLSGAFSQSAPWLLLGVGLLAAVLASAVVQTLARRQQFASTLVEERTRQLRETHEFLQRLLVSGPTVVLRADLSDPERAISYISPNVERIFGVDPDEILGGGGVLRWIHPDDAEELRATVERLREGNLDPEFLEFRLRHGDGSYRWVSSICVPELDDQGATVGAFVYLTDVSKRREAEAALRVAQLSAEAANRSKSEFLSRMSHELRTPLNAVLGFGQLLEMQPLTGDQADAVDQILKGGRHLLNLIDEVLDISRIETGRLLLSPEAVHVSEIVRESVELVRPLAEQREIVIVADEASMDLYVFADRQRTKQVLLNLLSNAVKYNRRRGTVAVSCTERTGTRLRVSVADTGPGIRPEQMDRLFTPFDRLDAAQSDVEGTGIGLTLSKHLAEAMGGALAVESVPGQGSTFSIDLPRVEGPVERYERHEPAVPASAASSPADGDGAATGPRHTLLYIEDNLSNLKLMERVLARRGDVDVVSAMQGRLGVELARQHHPEMILLDLHLPDVTGEEILRRLRDDPSTASIPIVMVTADATPGQVQRLLSAGATAYLTKPLDVGQLLGVVDEVLSGR